MPARPDIALREGQTSHGFEVTRVRPCPELRAVAYELEHGKSGARVLHLQAHDAENLFSITVPTPPDDDTGAPHILEHSVLAGSRRFPVREPFFEMVKMSMATFINAMTGPDLTYYPVSSNVKPDLFNLAEVYFDAVFHPLLSEQTFLREGHHYAPADPEDSSGGLTVNGIVYSEMKGAYSSPEWRLYQVGKRGLLPDTPCARDSAGDPEAIPDLTHAGLKTFHQTHYHPSQCLFLIYGDIPTADYAAFLSPRLDPFARTARRGLPAAQPRWEQARSLEDPYPIGPNESPDGKTYLDLTWLTGDAACAEELILMGVLTNILLGHEAAPLRKALVDSKLGADLTGSGAGAIGREAVFGVGLKGSEPDRVDAFVCLVLDTLRSVAGKPLDPAAVRAAFQQAAYEYLEVAPGLPLRVMRRVMAAWPHGRDPLAFLDLGRQLDACRRRSDADPQLFNRLIRERLLDNPHRLTVVLRPDREMQARTDTVFAERMREARARFSTEEVGEIASTAAELDRLNTQPNSPEALASLPQLSVDQLPERLPHLPTSVEDAGGVPLLVNEVFANGVNYLVLDLDLQGLPADLWSDLPRYVEAVHKLGAAGMDYAAIARRRAAETGGITCRARWGTHSAGPDRPLWSVRLRLKALDEHVAGALDILHDLLFAVDPRDPDRLQAVLTQSKARYRTDLVQQGSRTAVLHAGRGLNPGAHLQEQAHGFPQLRRSEQLADAFAQHGENLLAHIESIRDFLLVRGRVTAGFTGSDRALATVRQALSGWAADLRDEPVQAAATGFEAPPEPRREGLAGPTQVAHCALAMPAPHYADDDSTLLALGTHLVRLEYILNEVRLKGNAYGARFDYDAFGSTLCQSSFSDPHVARTLRVFTGVADFVRGRDWVQADVDRAIIATAKHGHQPIRPGPATDQALDRHLAGITPEMREARYARLRRATPKKVKRALLDLLDTRLGSAHVCVLSSREKLEQANRELGKDALAIEEMLR